jgi:hypothetical protein
VVAPLHYERSCPAARVIYSIDLLRFSTDTKLSKRDRRQLRQACQRLYKRKRSKASIIGKDGRRIRLRYAYRLRVPDQPRVSALLDQWHRAGRHFRFNYIEVAADFPTETLDQAEQLWSFVGEHLVRASGQFRVFDDTTLYWQDSRRKWPKVDVAAYADRLSKVVDSHALHLEWRFAGSKTVKAIGVTDPQSLGSLDLQGVIAARLKLRALVGEQALGRWLRRQHRKDTLRAVRNYVRRMAGTKFLPIQKLRDEYPLPTKYLQRQVYRTIDNSVLLGPFNDDQGFGYKNDPDHPPSSS